ncbi:hypothetical protein SAMN05216317_101114 [Nitrosomonas eutropha]|nr:hypothetical protein SAMN05216379_1389 [Nitrosomonas eutropha]SDW00928.1 hypothetical protein SAMN05216317_101114 [Nitrosomonas eutropha]
MNIIQIVVGGCKIQDNKSEAANQTADSNRNQVCFRDY